MNNAQNRKLTPVIIFRNGQYTHASTHCKFAFLNSTHWGISGL